MKTKKMLDSTPVVNVKLCGTALTSHNGRISFIRVTAIHSSNGCHLDTSGIILAIPLNIFDPAGLK